MQHFKELEIQWQVAIQHAQKLQVALQTLHTAIQQDQKNMSLACLEVALKYANELFQALQQDQSPPPTTSAS